MDCINLTGVNFGSRSLEAIEEFRRKHQLARMLRTMLPAGAMVTIFLGNDTLKASYSIYSTDFKALADAMQSVSAIERRVLLDIAQYAALDTTGAESKFWVQVSKGINNGCTYNF